MTSSHMSFAIFPALLARVLLFINKFKPFWACAFAEEFFSHRCHSCHTGRDSCKIYRHEPVWIVVVFYLNLGQYDFIILFWSSPNGIMSIRNPVRKEMYLPCLQWIECASVVIYSGVHMWIKSWGGDNGLDLPWIMLKACTDGAAHRLGGSEFQSVIVQGK